MSSSSAAVEFPPRTSVVRKLHHRASIATELAELGVDGLLLRVHPIDRDHPFGELVSLDLEFEPPAIGAADDNEDFLRCRSRTFPENGALRPAANNSHLRL
jgi:hypothetical protein